MNIQKFQNLKYLLIIGFYLSVADLWAGDLDLTALAKNQIRDRLQTVLPKLSAGLELPALLLSRPSKSGVLLTARYDLPDLKAISASLPGIPTFGLAVGITPTISLTGQLGAGRWQGESLNSAGLYVAYLWRKPSRPDQIICGINHVKGPNDFHFRDVSIGYSKLFRFSQWNLSLAGTIHTTQIGIHISDNLNSLDNYKTTKKIEFGLIDISLHRNIGEHLKIGMNLTFSQESLSGGLALGGYF